MGVGKIDLLNSIDKVIRAADQVQLVLLPSICRGSGWSSEEIKRISLELDAFRLEPYLLLDLLQSLAPFWVRM